MHDIWINPGNNNHLILGTDGGLYTSVDAGHNWRFIRNLPVSQFYRVSVDGQEPYNIYGGLQDNGSWVGPSRSPGGIGNNNWDNIGFGDGFYVLPDPYDDNILYWQYQGGNFMRKYLNTGEYKEIKPYPGEDMEDLRFNWNAPIAFSPSRNVIYVGAQFLFMSSDKGESWKKISPDLTTDNETKQQQHTSGGLTTDNSTAENYCSIFSISESPLDEKVIWAGTDDGNLQLTVDGGKKWKNVGENISGLPEGSWCSKVIASSHDHATAYATFDGHRSGDTKARVFKTTDLGRHWINLADSNINGYCRTILEDAVNRDLLFLGTESGLYMTINGGKKWVRFNGNIPEVAIHELAFQARENDLVIGTHGRGIMVIDDVSPLRDMSDAILGENVVYLGSRPYKNRYTAGRQSFTGDDDFIAPNPTEACYITYYLKKRHVFGDMYIEVYDANDKLIKTLAAGKRKGINRVKWQMRMKPPRVPASPSLLGSALFGPQYPPGDYKIRIIKGETITEGYVRILDEGNIGEEETALRYESIMRAYNLLENLAWLDKVMSEVISRSEDLLELEEIDYIVRESVSSMKESLETIQSELAAPSGNGMILGIEKTREKIAEIYGALNNYSGPPSVSQMMRLDMLETESMEKEKMALEIIEEEVENINNYLIENNIEPIKTTSKNKFFKEK